MMKQSWLNILVVIWLVSDSAYLQERKSEIRSENEAGFAIVGMIVQSGRGQNVALIKEAKNSKVRAVRIGDTILGHLKITAIVKEGITVVEKGKTTYMVVRDKFSAQVAKSKFGKTNSSTPSTESPAAFQDSYQEPGFQRVKGEITMSGEFRDRIVNQDLGKILMDATAEPYFQQGQIAGFKLSQITENSIYDKSGLRNNDIVTEINGQPLNSVAFAIRVLKSLKTQNDIVVRVLRDGASVDLSVRVQ